MDRGEEKRLLQQAQAGDADAFAALYRAHIQVIFRYVQYRVNDMQVAEDLTADVFTRMVEGLPGYVDRGVPLAAWLYRIAHARVVDHYRKRDRRPTEQTIETVPLPVEPNMDANLLRERAQEAIRWAMSALTDEQRQVIQLRFIQGASIDVTARTMGKKGNAIKALQFRAVRALASRLERSGYDIETLLAGLE